MNDIDNVNHCQVHLQQLASSDDSEAMALRACNAQVWHLIDHPSLLTLKERPVTNHATFALSYLLGGGISTLAKYLNIVPALEPMGLQ